MSDKTKETAERAEDTAPETTDRTEDIQESAAPAEGSPEWYAEKVSIRLFRDNGKYQDDVFVAVNGLGYLIKRGVEVQVPRFVAEVLKQSMEQDTATANLVDTATAEYEAESRRLGI